MLEWRDDEPKQMARGHWRALSELQRDGHPMLLGNPQHRFGVVSVVGTDSTADGARALAGRMKPAAIARHA